MQADIRESWPLAWLSLQQLSQLLFSSLLLLVLSAGLGGSPELDQLPAQHCLEAVLLTWLSPA